MVKIISIIASLGGLLLGSPALGEMGHGTPLRPMRIEINLPAYTLTLYSGDIVLRRYPIAIGSPRFRTPTGKYTLSEVIINPWWYPPKDSPWAEGKEVTPPGPSNPLGVAKMLLADGILIHGTGDPDGMRKALSHGCIRLENKDILELVWLLTQRDSFSLVRRGKTMGFVLDPPVPVEIRYQTIEREPALVILHPDVYARKNMAREIEGALKAEGVDIGESEARRLASQSGESPLEITTGQFHSEELRLLSKAML